VTALAFCACAQSTDATTDVADLRGTWRFTGDQTAPALTMAGTLVIESQSGDMVTGRLTWEEQAVGGGTRVDGGPVTGRVIDWTDVDFDVLLSSGERRHVGRLSADTMRGAWVQLSTGSSGEFLAVRGAP
jgi:hypothetical protein